MNSISTETLLAYFLDLSSVSIDSRTVEKGALFFGINGERFNGNAYAAKALENGASLVVVDDSEYYVESDSRYLFVEDSLKALQDLAHAYRQLFDIPVLGLTGSNGKTTTKELIYAVLQTEKRVHATAGNFNNHIGVPLTLLRMPKDTEIAIIEMGANQPGDIQELCEIAAPNMGLITNIGAAHLERLGSLEGVQETKGALFRYVLREGGLIFCNNEDKRVRALAKESSNASAFTYGEGDSDVRMSIFKENPSGMGVTLRHRIPVVDMLSVHTSLTGKYNGLNIAAAITVALHFGISKQNMKEGISSYVPTNNRSQILEKKGHRFWMDAYNANPSSMEAAIRNICKQESPQDLVLVLGDMLELGSEEVKYHIELGKFIQQFTPALTIGIGPLMQHTAGALKSPSKWYASTQDAKTHFWEDISGKPVVFLKGSRGMKLETLLED